MVNVIYRWKKVSFQRKIYKESNKCKQQGKTITDEYQHQKHLPFFFLNIQIHIIEYCQ